MSSSYELLIDKATLEDYTSIIKNSGKDVITPYSDSFHTVSYRDYKLLFSFQLLYPDIYEIHIVCPKDSILASRALSLYVISWIRSKYSNTKALVTNCPEGKAGKIANMVKRLGFRQVNETDFIYIY